MVLDAENLDDVDNESDYLLKSQLVRSSCASTSLVPEIKIEQGKKLNENQQHGPKLTYLKSDTSPGSTLPVSALSLLPQISLPDLQTQFPIRFWVEPATNHLLYCSPYGEKAAHARFSLREIEPSYEVYEEDSYRIWEDMMA